MPLISDRFPELQTSLAELVESHKAVEGEPLHLALAYDPCRQDDANQVFLFEVSENFGGDHINPEHQLFEVGFSGQQVFGAADRGRGLRLVGAGNVGSAPATDGVFQVADVERFRRVAEQIFDLAAKISSLVKRAYPRA